MKSKSKLLRPMVALLSLVMVGASGAADKEKAVEMKAADLAARLSALRQGGDSYVRVRMEIKGAKSQTLQLQIKERRQADSAEVVYQVLFPKERKGEAVLLRKTGSGPTTGSVLVPPEGVRSVNDPKEPLLGSDLAMEDVVDNFFAWKNQALVGTESVGGIKCSILESKSGEGEQSIYGSMRSWIDLHRMLPLRVEKYDDAGKVLRRIETTRSALEGGQHIPTYLIVKGPKEGSSTVLDGSRLSRDVGYSDRDFSVEGMKELAPPRRR